MQLCGVDLRKIQWLSSLYRMWAGMTWIPRLLIHLQGNLMCSVAVLENMRLCNRGGAIFCHYSPECSSVWRQKRTKVVQEKENPNPETGGEHEWIFVSSLWRMLNAFGGDEDLPKSCDAPFWGSIPLDPTLTQSWEDGQASIDTLNF